MYYFFRNPEVTGIFNLGTGKARSWNDLAHAMFSALGKEPVIEYMEMPESLRPRYQYFTQAEMDKLRKTGCNVKFHSLEEAVKDYIGYLKENAHL
jgi:ADP-L-glycero-D-manno-heptose 6-epimerase